MTLFEIVDILKKISLNQPNIRSVSDGSVYDALNNNPSVQYDVFHISQTNHREDENYDYYGFNLFYVSRLEDSLENNRLQIQSIGKEVLSNVIRTLCENFAIDYPTITYFPFTQRFNDLCAGVYCSLQLDVPKELWCADDYVAEVVPNSGLKLQDIGITITENGLRVITPDAEYDGIGEIRIQTNVPQSAAVLQDKEVEYTENGSYIIHPDPLYDGLSSVSVDVLVPDNYDEGYADGKQDGENEQKTKLTVTSFTENNTYTRENGWSAITIDVPSDYQEGYDDGEVAQKAKMVARTITENGEYGRPDGYSAITVNVPQDQGYEEGYKDGETTQKGKLTVTSFTENNTYTRENGWSAITIDVPSDYQDGYDNGAADQKAKLVSTAITENGTYSREDGYSSIEVNVVQTGQTINNQNISKGISASDLIYADGHYVGSQTITHLPDYTGIEKADLNIDIDASAAIEQGETQQKAKMVSTALTQNGTYSRENGYSVVTVNVDNRYDEGYNDGYRAGAAACSGLFATAITLNIPSAITDSGTATTTYSSSTAYTDIYYTSSDSTIAKIDENTGVITVLKNGTVTICTKDRMSGLQDCKSVNVIKTYSGDYITAIYNVTSTTSPTKIMNITTSFSGATLADGTFVPIATGYTFPTTGLNAVKYYISKTSLDNFLFDSCYQLAEIRMPNSITSIGTEGCFYNCHNLKTVILPSRITNLGDRTFVYCNNLSSITIPDSVKQIGIRCFSHCYSLSSLTIPSGVTSIVSGDQGSFVQCFVQPANFHNNSSLNAAQNQYWGLTLFDTEQTDGLCIKGNQAVNCRPSVSATSVVIPNSITAVTDRCFEHCTSLSAITWSSSLSNIGKCAFQECLSLTSVTIPDTVERLGKNCFNACSNLKNVTIGSGVTYIDEGAFLQCSNITSMRFLATTPPMLSTSASIPPLGSTSYTYPIYVPNKTAPYYKETTGWTPYADRVRS